MSDKSINASTKNPSEALEIRANTIIEAKTANDIKLHGIHGAMKAFMQEYKTQTEQAKDNALQEVWRILNG